MKKFARLLAFFLSAAICACVCAACALEKSTELKYFSFTLNYTGDGYVVAASSEEAPITIIIPAEYEGLPVTEIAENGFSGTNCANIKELVVKAENVTVGAHAFRGLPNLRYAEFRDTVNLTVGSFAFEGCHELKEIKFSDKLSVLSVNQFAFKSAGFETVEITAGNVTLGDYAFAACKSLKSFRISAATHTVSETAVDMCDALDGIEYVPAN